MSWLSQVVWILGISAMTVWPLAAQEQDPFCATQESIAEEAIQILNRWCWENDEKEGSLECAISKLKIIQFLQSCWETADPYLEAIYQQTSQKN